MAVQGRSQPGVPPGGRDAGWGRGTRQGRSNTAHIAHLIQKRITFVAFTADRDSVFFLLGRKFSKKKPMLQISIHGFTSPLKNIMNRN